MTPKHWSTTTGEGLLNSHDDRAPCDCQPLRPYADSRPCARLSADSSLCPRNTKAQQRPRSRHAALISVSNFAGWRAGHEPPGDLAGAIRQLSTFLDGCGAAASPYKGGGKPKKPHSADPRPGSGDTVVAEREG